MLIFLNVAPNNLVFLKISNTEFDEIIITFTDQNDRLLEIENKVNLRLLLSRHAKSRRRPLKIP